MKKHEKTLGEELREARQTLDYSLREVEEATGISNAYLSQLENGKIKKPSANVLYKLASLYKIDFDLFLMAAGIIQGDSVNVTRKSLAGAALKSLAGTALKSADDLTPEEEEELSKYLAFLRFRKKR